MAARNDYADADLVQCANLHAAIAKSSQVSAAGEDQGSHCAHYVEILPPGRDQRGALLRSTGLLPAHSNGWTEHRTPPWITGGKPPRLQSGKG